MARRSRVVQSSSDSEGDHASSSEADSDDSPRNELLDIEAAESDASSEDSATLGYDDDDDDDESHPRPVFTKFNDLPPELRRHIWELFCPDLVNQARVLNFDMNWHALHHRDFNAYWRFQDGMALADQTEALRRVSAVHKESREMALNRYPDTLRLEAGSGDAVVCFNKDRDIVFFNNLTESEPLYSSYDDGFCNHIRHAAFQLSSTDTGWTPGTTETLEAIAEKIEHFIHAMPNLTSVFLSRSHHELSKHQMRWCGSPMMRYSRVETYNKRPGLGEDLEWMYCWPDPNNRWEETTRQLLDNFPNELPHSLPEALESLGVKLAPMVCFEFESGQALFNRLVQKHDLGKFSQDGADEDEESSSESDEGEEEPNEYESEGIDDAEIASHYSSSEDELIPDPISAEGSPEPGNFSPSEGDDGIRARFSSPEPEAEDDEDEDVEPAARIPKRRIVSDSEEDDDDEPRAKRVRTERVVVDDSSDDDEDEAPRGASQRSRAGRAAQVISSDSESSAEENDDKNNLEGEDSQSESENDEEDDKPPARLSLAERLRLHREENPVGLSDEDNSQDGSDEENSFINDDEEEDGDDGPRDGFLDDMAEQSDGDGEDQSEDGW